AVRATDSNAPLSLRDFASWPAATSVPGARRSFPTRRSSDLYIVVELLQSGWTQSNVPDGNDIVAATGTGLGDFGYAITLTSNQTDSANNFRNFRHATKTGTNF